MNYVHFWFAGFVLLLTGVHLTLVLLFTRAMRKPRVPPLTHAPRVSVLKPLAGLDDCLDDNLASFAQLDYPSYEVLFGVASETDPAAGVAKSFMRANPGCDAKLVVTRHIVTENPKVAQLIALQQIANGDVFVVSDSNVRVNKHYLSRMVAPLLDRSTGLVTSLFVGTGGQTAGAALENLQINSQIAPSIVASTVFARRPFTIGKSMAMRRRDLVTLGGFARVAHVLAEDHLLGRLFTEAGYGIGTVLAPVENRNLRASFARSWERHSRWAKMRRHIEPVGYCFEPLASPHVLATLAFVLSPSVATAALAGTTLLFQTGVASLSTRAATGKWLSPRDLPLEGVRTWLMFACWVHGWFSNTLLWRGHRIRLGHDSEILGSRSARSPARGTSPHAFSNRASTRREAKLA